ncbi:MAG: hypothetical protein ACTHMS_08820 [Jatrophihabitans sp.]|uniref:hypothetical protein n=1 Tax=Jatrophihabitans sp. TaxID=1932789 RepID=UPI003F7EF9E6
MHRRIIALLTVLVAAVAAVGCSSGSSSNDGQRCRGTCTGSIDGAAYVIRLPGHWNGTLLVYTHGYRDPATPRPGRAVVSVGEDLGLPSDPVVSTLLGQGYALAGSSTAAGWTPQQATAADKALYERFVYLHGTPKRTLAWGGSMGGLITTLLAEGADWVDGAAPMCGVVAGPLRNFDNMREAIWATRALLLPDLQVTGFASRAAAAQAGAAATTAIAQAAAAGGDRAARVAYLALTLGLPLRSPQHPAGPNLAALADNLGAYVTFALTLGHDFRQRFGGDPGQAQPPPAPTPTISAAVAVLGGDAATYAAALAATSPFPADAAARQAAEASGDPTGRLQVPTIALHGLGDPIAIPANEAVLAQRVAAAGTSGRLLQVYAPAVDAASGIGHCVFSSRQVVGTIDALDAWVRTGSRPGTVPGTTTGADVGNWPEA